MFQPTPRQSLSAMQAAAAIYTYRMREQQRAHYWHLKNTPALARAIRRPALISRQSRENATS